MRRLSGLVLVLLLCPRPAHADATAFVGSLTTPEQRLTRGFALGVSLLVLGIEFEYASADENETEAAPALRTGMANLLVQTPPLSGVQLYGTAGGGLYRENLGTLQETNVGTNIGGGAKISIVGPLRLRLDFRVFRLAGSAIEKTPKRFYAGANLAF